MLYKIAFTLARIIAIDRPNAQMHSHQSRRNPVQSLGDATQRSAPVRCSQWRYRR